MTENLTDDEVSRAELMSLRVMFAVMLHHFFATHPNPQAAYDQIESAVVQIVGQIPLQAIAPDRQQTYRDLVVERASSLLLQARAIQHRNVGKPN